MIVPSTPTDNQNLQDQHPDPHQHHQIHRDHPDHHGHQQRAIDDSCKLGASREQDSHLSEAAYLADDDATVELSKDEAAAVDHGEQQLVVPTQKAAQITGTTKRRSTWRHLLSPSYKSRSDEFHKCFAAEIPKGERLIADYSCALHREFLIQGRLYVSVNYLAFYSNLFSWITRLVVRLRDIRDIHKANTAKIIPNAIQILTHSNEKHVFASFIARDKSYLLIWRIWRNNNMLKERLSDQEIRKLVHLSYGKDLGLNDLEESKISAQPLPRTPASFIDEDELQAQEASEQLATGQQQQQVVVLDRNNNDGNINSLTKHKFALATTTTTTTTTSPKRSRFRSRSQNQRDLMELIDEEAVGAAKTGGKQKSLKRGHARFSSLDYSKLQAADAVAGLAARTPNQVDAMLNELSGKLAELSAGAAIDLEPGQVVEATRANSAVTDLLLNQTCSPASSAVVVDTPASVKLRRSRELQSSIECNDQLDQPEVGPEARQIFAPNLVKARSQLGTSPGSTITPQASEGAPAAASSISCSGGGGGGGNLISEQSSVTTVKCGSEQTARELVTGEGDEAQQRETPQPADPMGPPLNTRCDCDAHEGDKIVDEELDINVDILFSLIFTNSKFMRAYMTQRGQEDLVVGKWRRPAGQGGDRSNSSTLSSRESDNFQSGAHSNGNTHRRRQGSSGSAALLNAKKNFKTKQVRQLNYSMNVNHVLAKQVQVEERQNICQVRPGVYVLESQTINSGFPCSESFTVDLKYCLTRTGHVNKSRLRVHGLVNFLKEKQSWRLAMVKPIIEKQSMQGLVEFIKDLTESIKKYIEAKKQQGDPTVYIDTEEQAGDNNPSPGSLLYHSPASQLQQQPAAELAQGANGSGRQPELREARDPSLSSLARAKSKLKERRLRTMYKYYIQSRSHQGDSSASDAEEEVRSRSSSIFSSSMSSSICGGGLDDDDDESMIMMMTAQHAEQPPNARRPASSRGTRTSHQLRASHQYLRDDSDDGGGDYVAALESATGFRVGRRSFSDLEDGPVNQQSAINHYHSQRYPRSDADEARENSPIRRRHHMDSETSNATLNNQDREQPGRPRRRPHASVDSDAHQPRHPSSCATARARPSAYDEPHNQNHTHRTHHHHHHQQKWSLKSDQDQVQPQHRGCARHSGRLFQSGDAEDPQSRQQQQPARLLQRLLTTRNLVSLTLISLVLLVFAMVVSHAIILRRLGQLEQLLLANCNSLQPLRLQSSRSLSLAVPPD